MSAEQQPKEYRDTITKIDAAPGANAAAINAVLPTGRGDFNQDGSRKTTGGNSLGFTGEWARSKWVPQKDRQLATQRAAAKEKPQQPQG